MGSCERIVCRDKSGTEFRIGGCGPAQLSSLLDMYAGFSPRPASQGLPPEDPETCTRWVGGLMEMGENLLAWREEKIIGHAALVPDPKGDSAEFVIFVHQVYRGLGIGTELTRATLDRARRRGLKSVWLTVAMSNFIAIRLYRKLGFDYSDMDECERTMIIRL
ncbi:MAG: GNAT family N-acetyltransferase [Thermodesulfobacteriota bacterium]